MHTLSDVASSIVMSDTAIKEHKMTFLKITENQHTSLYKLRWSFYLFNWYKIHRCIDFILLRSFIFENLNLHHDIFRMFNHYCTLHISFGLFNFIIHKSPNPMFVIYTSLHFYCNPYPYFQALPSTHDKSGVYG